MMRTEFFLRRDLSIAECIEVEGRLIAAGYRISDDDEHHDEDEATSGSRVRRKLRYLTHNEERELGRRIQLAQSLPTDTSSLPPPYVEQIERDADKARATFVAANYRYVQKLASRYGATRHLTLDDLIQEGQAPDNAGPLHMKIAVIDLETTGLDPQYDEIIEIAAAILRIDAGGRIIAGESLRTGLQQPSRPIEPHIAKITAIDDAMVAGKRICPHCIATYLGRAQACLAFNAEFDRRHLEMLVPEVGAMPWICAMADLP